MRKFKSITVPEKTFAALGQIKSKLMPGMVNLSLSQAVTALTNKYLHEKDETNFRKRFKEDN